MIRAADVRGRFAIDPALRLLNHGSFGACPREVLAAAERERLLAEADPWRFMRAVPERLRAVADALGPRLGARGEDLALVENATTGVCTVLRSLDLRPGDRLVTTSHVYGAVRKALRHVAARAGAVVDDVPVPFPLSGPDDVLAAVLPHLDGARLAVLDAITSPTGLVLPFDDLVAACRARGVPVLLDAAHAPGQVPLDLDALGADWVTGNLHKWMFAAKGTAFLWARADRRDGLVPLAISHDLDLGFPRAFDWTGTRDFAPWLALPAALAFVDGLGGEAAVRAHNDALCARAASRLAEAWDVALPAPASMRAAMATIPVPGDVPASASQLLFDALLDEGLEPVVVPFAGLTWVRISAQVFVEEADVDALAEAVPRILGLLPEP